jgi:hypothetical protein
MDFCLFCRDVIIRGTFQSDIESFETLSLGGSLVVILSSCHCELNIDYSLKSNSDSSFLETVPV